MQSSTSPKVLEFSEKPFVHAVGVELPGITNESQRITFELLEKNHQEFDIFFNERLLHNHLVHHVLAAYSCGATPSQIKKIFDANASYQRPKPPSHVTITKENWLEHLGRSELWTDYLKFFDDVVKEEGMGKALEYAFHPQMFPRLFAGAFHPIIHVGYGVEFQIPMILSEGLAQTAVHANRLSDFLNEDLLSAKETGSKKLIDIINEIRTDQRFDGVLTLSVNGKLQKLLSEKADLVREISKTWFISETEEGLHEAALELFEACALVYGATGINPGKEKITLDFFLMHGFTSMLLVYSILPYVNLDKRRMLLRGTKLFDLSYAFLAHSARIISEYISRGRPRLHIDAVVNYVPKKLTEEPNSWLDVVRLSLLEESDAHVIKVIRSLLKINEERGKSRKDNIFLKIAQITYDGFKEYDWSEDIGFEEH